MDIGPQSPRPPEGQPPGPRSPLPPAGPQAPPADAPYGGPVPPGGWTQPLAPSSVPTGTLASWGSRAGAWILDLLIVLIPAGIVIALAVSALVGGDAGVIAVIFAGLASFAILTVFSLVYAPLTMIRGGAHNGQTFGKQLFGIRVVRTNGRPVDIGTAALREAGLKTFALGVASSFIPIVPFLVDYLWPLFDDDNQAVHDIIASTRVVEA